MSRQDLSNSISGELPDALIKHFGQDAETLQAFWSENRRYLHPVILVSETVRIAREFAPLASDMRSSLIGLEAFRQIGVPLIADLPGEFTRCLGSDNSDENGQPDFERVLVAVYENARLLISRIIEVGPGAHHGTGNGFAVFVKIS